MQLKDFCKTHVPNVYKKRMIHATLTCYSPVSPLVLSYPQKLFNLMTINILL